LTLALQSLNPLIGHNVPLGPRFPATSDAYDVPFRLSFFRAARELSLFDSVASGTYAYVSGPSYESRAECKFLRSSGADCVGMSTVPEILAARHAGLRVLGISLVTNKVVVTPYFDAKAAIEREAKGEALEDQTGKDSKEAATHEEVLEVGLRRAEDVRRL
jgi:purine-nucleoside phosphorylase